MTHKRICTLQNTGVNSRYLQFYEKNFGLRVYDRLFSFLEAPANNEEVLGRLLEAARGVAFPARILLRA